MECCALPHIKSSRKWGGFVIMNIDDPKVCFWDRKRQEIGEADTDTA